MPTGFSNRVMKKAEEMKQRQHSQLEGGQGERREECWSTGLSVTVVVMTTLGVNVLLYLRGLLCSF